MAEYIERGMAIAKLTALEIAEPCATLTDARWLLADMPAADVAPIVRCEKCMYHTDELPGVVYCSHEIGGWVLNEHFCPRGKRRTDANEPDGA